SRRTYFMWCIFGVAWSILCIAVPLFVLEAKKAFAPTPINHQVLLNPLLFRVAILCGILIPLALYVSSSIRRCHDLGYTGWLTLFSLVPCFNLMFFCWLLFKIGTPG